MADYVLALVAVAAVMLAFRLRGVSRRARALEEQGQQLRQQKELVVDFMHEMVEALGEGLDRTLLFQRIARAAVRCTGAVSACAFELTPENTLRGVAVEGLFPPPKPLPESSRVKLATRAKFIEQVMRSATLQIGEGVIGRVAETKQAELVADGKADPRIVDHGDAALAVRSLIAAPIVFRDRLIGVLAVANPASGAAFTDTDFSLVQSLAEQAGLAVHNNEFLALEVEKRQMDVELSLARSIQMMLVPGTVARVTGLDIDARYIPAQKVGGDLVDVLVLPGGRLAVVVADVAGKGVAASILMAICRTHLRHGLRAYTSPSAILREVNRSLAGEMREGMFITALLAILEPGQNRLVFARAGHEAPVLARINPSTGACQTELVSAEGMALGMVEPAVFDPEIEDRTVPFGSGDILVLYTDGVTEAIGPDDKEFSSARLMDTVKTLRAGTCAEINTGILESVERFTGLKDYRDDLTLVTVKRVEAG